MQHDELEIALDELETRLERLRALYEQYFLGIEKIEPTVARKDVDRRFWMLRRTQIRNTAKRFKLQTLVQRYNTFQQYWARICREIENGTYTRHLLKAQKKYGTEPKTFAAKRRLGRQTLRSDAPPAGRTATEQTQSDLQEMLATEISPEEATRRALEAARAGRDQGGGSVRKPSGELDLELESLSNRGAAPARKAPPPRSRSPQGPAVPPPVPRRASAMPGTASGSQSARRQAEAGGGLSDQRLRELHTELVAKKRQLNERSNVSLESLGKSLRAAATKLQKSKGGNVDFRVIVKDGKAIVRPIVRK